MASVEYRCPSCQHEVFQELELGCVVCPHCGVVSNLEPLARNEQGQLVRCPMCGLKVLYHQKDFNRKLGCTVVLIAAILAPFTYYLSLVAAALLDLLLYGLTPEVIVCYRPTCQTRIRGIRRGPWVKPFDLLTHDYYRSQPDATEPPPAHH